MTLLSSRGCYRERERELLNNVGSGGRRWEYELCKREREGIEKVGNLIGRNGFKRESNSVVVVVGKECGKKKDNKFNFYVCSSIPFPPRFYLKKKKVIWPSLYKQVKLLRKNYIRYCFKIVIQKLFYLYTKSIMLEYVLVSYPEYVLKK